MGKKFPEFRIAIEKVSEEHLSLHSKDLSLYIFTDASKLYWSRVLAGGLIVDTEMNLKVLRTREARFR